MKVGGKYLMFSHLTIFREIATWFTSLRVSPNTIINDMLNLHMVNKINHIKSRTKARKPCWGPSPSAFKTIRAKS